MERSRGRPSPTEVAEIDRRILDAAADAFGRFGFEAAQMEKVAKAAGITKVTLYRRFENKAALLQAVVAQLSRKLADVGTTAPRVGEPMEDLKLLTRHYRQHSARPEVLALQRLVIAQMPYQPSLREPLDAIRVAYVEPMDTLLLSAIAAGLIRERPVQEIRELIFDLLINDVASLAFYDYPPNDDDAWFEWRWSILQKAIVAS